MVPRNSITVALFVGCGAPRVYASATCSHYGQNNHKGEWLGGGSGYHNRAKAGAALTGHMLTEEVHHVFSLRFGSSHLSLATQYK